MALFDTGAKELALAAYDSGETAETAVEAYRKAKVEGAALGYGMARGKAIWVVLPYVAKDRRKNEITWWGDVEATVGYAERAYSLVNNYRFTEGRLRGFTLGLVTSYQQNYRAYMYNDAADGNKRKMFYFPNRMLHDMFASYGFRVNRFVRASVQINVSNLLCLCE